MVKELEEGAALLVEMMATGMTVMEMVKVVVLIAVVVAPFSLHVYQQCLHALHRPYQRWEGIPLERQHHYHWNHGHLAP